MLPCMSCPDFKLQQLFLKMFLEIYLCALLFTFLNTRNWMFSKQNLGLSTFFVLLLSFFWLIKFRILMLFVTYSYLYALKAWKDQDFSWRSGIHVIFLGKNQGNSGEKIKNSVWTLARKPKSTFLCLINEGTGNLITLVPRLFLFVDEDQYFIRTVMQNKSGT